MKKEIWFYCSHGYLRLFLPIKWFVFNSNCKQNAWKSICSRRLIQNAVASVSSMMEHSVSGQSALWMPVGISKALNWMQCLAIFHFTSFIYMTCSCFILGSSAMHKFRFVFGIDVIWNVVLRLHKTLLYFHPVCFSLFFYSLENYTFLPQSRWKDIFILVYNISKFAYFHHKSHFFFFQN
jgi:hypothetical protein